MSNAKIFTYPNDMAITFGDRSGDHRSPGQTVIPNVFIDTLIGNST